MVRLSELVNQARRRISEGQNLARNPVQMAWQWGRKRLMLAYGKASLGSENTEDRDQSQEQPVQSVESPRAFTSEPAGPAGSQTYFEVDSRQTVPLTHLPHTATEPQNALLFTAPVLQPGERLQGGWWGVYTIKSCICTYDWMRCYDGLQDNGGEPVWIYEYCLDKDSWSEDEVDERKQRFKHLVDLNLRLGGGADFRIIRPKDVIKPADNCIYLITRPVPHSHTLDEFLTQNPVPWNRFEIERFLTQVLQSLQYLQTYLVNWPGDRWEQGLSHGNLSSDCLWLRLPDGYTELKQSPFFVYLGRFPLWEQLFWPQNTSIPQHNWEIGSIDDDLHTLAHIAFALVRGYESEDNPADLNLWPEDNSVRTLYPYVLQLMGHGETGGFKSIESAISVLQTLPETASVSTDSPQTTTVAVEEDESSGRRTSALLSVPLLLLGGGVLLSLLTWLVMSLKPGQRQIVACNNPCRLADVETYALTDPIRYGIEADSSWGKAFFSRLTSPLSSPSGLSRSGSSFGTTELQRTLEERDSSLPLEKARNVLISRNLLLEYVRTESLDVAFIQTTLNLPVPELPSDLIKRVVGYDGIAIFVTHSNPQRQDSIPQRLQGRISLEQLRRVLLDPNAPLDGARVQIYWPEDERTIDFLRDIVFDSDVDRTVFDQRRLAENRFPRTESRYQTKRRENNMYERMVRDFEANTGIERDDIIGIGFNRISQVMGQCSVYPLAIVEGSQTHHLLTNSEGKPIDPSTDLCGDKGTYWVNDRPFQEANVTYPLAYEMSVAYHLPTNAEACDRYAEGCAKGQLMVDKLLTPEGQYLLSEVGVVPVLPMKNIRRMIWSPMAQGGTP
ncbi:MAG: hypothetical protein AAF821_12800 [Cyanobacteria bacterium P01_D01_bin.156]